VKVNKDKLMFISIKKFCKFAVYKGNGKEGYAKIKICPYLAGHCSDQG
jgi:hypothetical protein